MDAGTAAFAGAVAAGAGGIGVDCAAGSAEAGGFFLKKLNIRDRKDVEETEAAGESVCADCEVSMLSSLAILAGSGALAQSVRATES